MREYFTMGRHWNIGLFLRVSITRVPHHACPIQIQPFDFEVKPRESMAHIL